MATRIEFDEKLPQQIFAVSYEMPYRGGGIYMRCNAYKTRKFFEDRVKFLRTYPHASNIQTFIYTPQPIEVS